MEVNKFLNESSKIKNHYTNGYNTVVKLDELTDANTGVTSKNTVDQSGTAKNGNTNSVMKFFKKLTRWQRPKLEIVPTRLSFLMDGGWHR